MQTKRTRRGWRRVTVISKARQSQRLYIFLSTFVLFNHPLQSTNYTFQASHAATNKKHHSQPTTQHKHIFTPLSCHLLSICRSSHSHLTKMKLNSPLLATALASLANSQSPATAIITIEASHGGAGNGLTNETISVPLLTRYTNPALNTVSTLYLTGSNGDVRLQSIACYPYRNDNLTGMGGLPFTSETPSRLSTNTVSVGSIMCNSTDVTTDASAGAEPSVTSTLSATTTDLTRGGTSDVPNLSETLVVPASITSSSARSNDTMITMSPSTTSVPVASSGGASQETVTSVAVVTEGTRGPMTSTMVSVVGASPTGSSSPADMGSAGMSSGADQTGSASERWRVNGLAVIAMMLGFLM